MKRIAGLLRRGERAQGTVEFALVVPLFLFLLLGVLEFSWALYTHTTLVHAAQEGVRRGIVLSTVNVPGGAFLAVGNKTGTYPGPIACDRNTIVGTAACQMGAVPLDRTDALVCPSTSSPTSCPTAPTTLAKPYPEGLRVELQLNHRYRPMILGFFPWLDNIVMTGHAEGYTQ